jgi:hypothetical protein
MPGIINTICSRPFFFLVIIILCVAETMASKKLIGTGTVYSAHPEKLVEEFNGRYKDGYTFSVTLGPAIAKLVLVDILHELPHPVFEQVAFANVIHSLFKGYEYHIESVSERIQFAATPSSVSVPPIVPLHTYPIPEGVTQVTLTTVEKGEDAQPNGEPGRAGEIHTVTLNLPDKDKEESNEVVALPAIELKDGRWYKLEKLGIWASCTLCTVVSWSLPGEMNNDDLRALLPDDIAKFYGFPMSGGNPGKIFSSEIIAMFKMNAIHPASAPWCVMEALLTKANAKLRVPLEAPWEVTVEIQLNPADEWDMEVGDAESRVKAVLCKALYQLHPPPPPAKK